MISSRNWSAYIAEHCQSEITVGKGGAHVCLLDDGTIAKHIRRESLPADQWESYRKEFLFYQSFSAKNRSFLPEVFYTFMTGDEILLILKQYHPLQHTDVNQPMLERILKTLASVHALPIPEFLPRSTPKPSFLDDDTIFECLRGWNAVLAEYPGIFDADKLTAIAKTINSINQTLYSRSLHLTHGDFHCDNLLLDDAGTIKICDFQTIGVGDVSGDISFFLSRLAADGYPLEQEVAIQTYCRYAQQLGMEAKPAKIQTQMALSNLNVSFRFWHIYLHGSDKDRIRMIYEKMLDDFDCLTQ